MTFAEIEALPSAVARMAAYQAYVEQAPNHPLAWFNLAVEAEAARVYDGARTAAETVRRLDSALFAMLPERVRQLFQGGAVPAMPEGEISGYRITGVSSASESQILYDAVRTTDGTPVTLWRVLDLSHASAKLSFQLAVGAPRVDGIACPIEVIEDPERGPLLVLERIRGDLLRGDPHVHLDAEVALRLIRAVARVVLDLQRAGALHGDLRPEAVVRDHARSEGIVVIGGRRAGAASPTPRGRLAWQSPEEVAGEAPTAATDVYNLGLLLHNLLTGAEPAALAARAPIRAASGWPELDALIALATARAPAERPGLDGLIAQIDQLVAHRDTPRVIGKWRIGRMLGEGSFGRVFAAENVDISGLRAAVKVLHPLMARDRDIRRRFLNEASAASQINHPGVVRILDGGVEQDGICYVAMELLEGSDLGARLAQRPLSLDLAVRLIRQAASALAVSHAQQIVHRDIKPSNLFIERRGDGEHLRILDFGIALLRGEPTREGIPYTATGHVWGTPEYMAPEQWQMLKDLDGRVDVYSLGLVLWECLAGRRPFTASTVFEWQQAHLSAPLPRLLDAAPAVPPRLVALVERMLAKRREDRISTMDAVIAELDAIVAMPHTYRVEIPAVPPPSVPPPALPPPPVPPPVTPAPLVATPAGIATAASTPVAPFTPSGMRPDEGSEHRWIAALGVIGAVIAVVAISYVATRPDNGSGSPRGPRAPDCTDRVFLEWGPARQCGTEGPVWTYDQDRGRCLSPLFSLEELGAEVERLRAAGASGFDALPAGFRLVLGNGIEIRDGAGRELPKRSYLFVSYRVGRESLKDRDGGIRINDRSPAFLSRDGHWCDERGQVLASAARKP